MAIVLQKGDHIKLTIDSLAFGGQGIGRFQDYVIFVDYALPGQIITAKIIKLKKNYAEGRIVEIHQQSQFYTAPRCIHFGVCGGCSFQHLEYNQQLFFKEQQVKASLERLGGFTDISQKPIVAAADIFSYRNKMEFSFSPFQWRSNDKIVDLTNQPLVFLGLHAKNFYNKVIDIDQCHLIPPIINDMVRVTREFARATRLPAYDAKRHNGFWRFLVVRCCQNSQDLMINLVTSNYDFHITQSYKNLMSAQFPEITSLLYSTTQSKSGVAIAEREYLLYGRNTITEKLNGYTFEISANSFFQTNTRQTENLYRIIAELAQVQQDQIVYDLYCGAGTIAIYLSRFARQVIGFEIVAAAVENAQKNARENKIGNCEFIKSDLRHLATDYRQVLQRYGKPDVLIIDPPRSGMHPNTIEAILELAPQTIIHVSCNPTTLARDLKLLCQEKYLLKIVQPIDMFPHTHHIEVVAQLALK